MDEIRILPTNGKDLLFEGELIAQESSEGNASELGDRWFELHIYRRSTSGYVPSIEYHTTYENEENVVLAEVVDSAEDVEKFFFVFEPGEFLRDKAIRKMTAEERQQLTKSMLKLYDSLVNRVLLTLKRHVPDTSSEDKDSREGEENKDNRRLFGFLG